MAPRIHRHTDSPVGTLTLVGTGRRLSGLYMEGHRAGPPADALGDHAPAGFGPAIEQLGDYFAGRRTAFDLELEPWGTPFQQRVWAVLRAIPYGETRSYAEVARAIGAPAAIRAVAMANARNPISVIVPCHRVIGSDGRLTGYAGGLARKRFLLDLEAATAA